MTDEDKILMLRTGLESADRKLELILGEPPPKSDEWSYTVALGVRRIIQRTLKKTGFAEDPAAGTDQTTAPGCTPARKGTR